MTIFKDKQEQTQAARYMNKVDVRIRANNLCLGLAAIKDVHGLNPGSPESYLYILITGLSESFT